MSTGKKKAGQPSKYKPEFCEQLIEHRRQGLSFESFAATINVSRETLYAFSRRHKEFAEARERAKDVNLKTLEMMGIGLITGKLKGSYAAWIFMMRNQQGWGDSAQGEENVIEDILFIE